MNLDHSFEDTLNQELASRHAENTLPEAFNAELVHYQTAQVIQSSKSLDAIIDSQEETELERVVAVYKRPSLLVKDGVIEESTSDIWGDIIGQHRNTLNRSVQSVGRIELKNHGQLAWCGTGFLIDEDRIITNRHVAEEFIEFNGEGYHWKRNRFSGKYVRGRIDFLEEYRNPDEDEINIIDIEYIASWNEPDIAILKLENSAGVSPLSLSEDISPDKMILTIGYPWRDSRVTEDWEEIYLRIFKDIYDVKRAAPGKIIDVHPDEFTHDCSTLLGNSGSACIDMETGKVLGVHYGGQRLRNLAVSSSYITGILR